MALLERPKGATLDEIMKATGRQALSVRERLEIVCVLARFTPSRRPLCNRRRELGALGLHILDGQPLDDECVDLEIGRWCRAACRR